MEVWFKTDPHPVDKYKNAVNRKTNPLDFHWQVCSHAARLHIHAIKIKDLHKITHTIYKKMWSKREKKNPCQT